LSYVSVAFLDVVISSGFPIISLRLDQWMTIPLQSKKLQSCQSGKLNAETAGLKSEHIQKANGLEKKNKACRRMAGKWKDCQSLKGKGRMCSSTQDNSWFPVD
jgi:hypothetical protein